MSTTHIRHSKQERHDYAKRAQHEGNHWVGVQANVKPATVQAWRREFNCLQDLSSDDSAPAPQPLIEVLGL